MSKLIVAAIPAEDDYVWKLSSEKVPHMTILFLGDALQVSNLASMAGFVQHATEVKLRRFGLDVDRRGTLGEDEADVLFFSEYGLKDLRDYRANLLQDHNIRTAYDSVEQFPEWHPHLTLGYPETPAKSDERDYPSLGWVNFDRIGFWFGDYDGLEFPLQTYYDYDLEVAMSSTAEAGSAAVGEILHYGVKGMRWRVRRGKGTPTAVTVADKGKKLKTSGGKNLPAHEDAVRARTAQQKAKASGVKVLSNQELQELQNRLNLEQNVKRLNAAEQTGAKAFVRALLTDTAKQQARNVANQKATEQVNGMLKKKT